MAIRNIKNLDKLLKFEGCGGLKYDSSTWSIDLKAMKVYRNNTLYGKLVNWSEGPDHTRDLEIELPNGGTQFATLKLKQ